MTIKTIHPGKKFSNYFLPLVFLAAFFTPSLTFGQAKTITGNITGSDGAPVTGVTVQEKGAAGTATDSSGSFSLKVSKPDATIMVSALGYKPQTIALGGRANLSIILQGSAAKELEQVVVIGYGSATKRDLTGSIASISGKEVADKPNANPLASLEGKVAGLFIANSGKVGQEPDIRLRGTVSLGQTKPLYIVDGIFADNIDFVNPSDIESIQILKDASSLAIFGVRGANGVILVTRKSGKVGQLVVNLSTTVGIQKISDKLPLVDATGYKTLVAEQIANAAITYPYLDIYTGNTNWQDAISQNGFTNFNNLSVTHATDKNKLYMGVGYSSQEGLIKHELLQKYLLNFGDELKVAKGIKIGINMSGYYSNLPTFQDRALFLANQIAPVVTPFNTAKGLYNEAIYTLQNGQIENPLQTIEESGGAPSRTKAKANRITGNIFAEINILKHVTLKATYYADILNNDTRSYNPVLRGYNEALSTIDTFNRVTSVTQSATTSSNFQQDYLMTYSNKLGNHGLTLLGGFSTVYNKQTGINGKVQQYSPSTIGALPIPDDPRFWYLDNSFGDPSTRTAVAGTTNAFLGTTAGITVADPLQWERSTVSAFARLLYNYKSKYFFNASFRRDGSSDISPSNRFQNFYAFGVAWELTKENFLQNQTLFNLIKLKASNGLLGNQYAGFHYPFYPILAAQNAVFGPAGNQQLIQGYSPAYLPSDNLHWETVQSTDIGGEFAMLNNALKFEAVYFKKLTKDLLTGFPGINGTKPGLANAGSIQNTGVELSANYSNKLNNGFGYSISANLTTLKNRVVSLFAKGYEIFAGPAITKVGSPIGSFYGYVVEGVYQDSADVANSPSSGAKPGDLKFADISGPVGKLDTVIDANDRTIIGNPTPKGIYGISLNFTYKGFDLGIDMQGVYGNQVFRDWGNGVNYTKATYRSARLNRWHGKGTSNWEPILNDLDTYNQQASTYKIESGSYFRIRNVQLGYSFSKLNFGSALIKSAKIFVGVQNLKTFKHNSGYTPEVGGSALSFGVDGGGYPVPAIYTAGFNISF